MTEIRAATAADMERVRELLHEYVAWIGLDLSFQEVDTELKGLPGKYAPPSGALLVAGAEHLVGMVALRRLDETICEMKRLYVSPAGRGSGLGRALVERILSEGRRLGYNEMRLDTLPQMAGAQSLYLALGFREIPPYYQTPLDGTRFMAINLQFPTPVG